MMHTCDQGYPLPPVHTKPALSARLGAVATAPHQHAGEQRISTAFAAARDGRRSAALMPFFVGGFPSLDASREIGEAYADGGADIVELGIPCSDAHADGPVIRAAGAVALGAGTNVEGVLDVARAVSSRVAVIVMCYASLLLARGLQEFADELHTAGVSGLIVPDLTLEEAPGALQAFDAAAVALVPLITPTTPQESVGALAARARGFVYAVSASGTTGERATLAAGVGSLISRVKEHTALPVTLGFGISSPSQAAQAASAGADGVIVGSRLVRAAAEAADPSAAVRELVAELSAVLKDDCLPDAGTTPTSTPSPTSSWSHATAPI